jgi:hypothetical protein
MLPSLALALCAAGAPSARDLDELVGRIARAYGGEKALSQVKAFRETGALESPRGVARTVRTFAPPDRLRVEIVYPGGNGEVRVLDGARGYRDGESVEGPPRDAMVLQAARLDLPFLLLRSRKKLIDLGDVERGGERMHGIGIPLGRGLNLAVTVDPGSARIVRSEGALPGPGGQIRFATDYSDFREVQGLLFAFREASFASGQRTGETRLEKIELLQSLPESTFRP